MKKKFLDSSIGLITRNKDYTDEQVEIMAYGLEAIYLTVTKMIVIFVLAYALDIFIESFLLFIAYGIIRTQAFGLHASKSWHCLIISTLLIVGGGYICKYVMVPFWLMLVCAIICNICLFLYAPADTHKRPLINEKKRKKFKIVSCVWGIFYTILIMVFRNYPQVNFLLFGMIEAVIVILPVTYKIFNLPYNNYKAYNCGV